MSEQDDTVIIREADDDVLSRPSAAPEQERRREAAFTAGYSWNGKPFEGLSQMRKMLCDAIAHKAGFPRAYESSTFEQFAPYAKAIVFVCATETAFLRKLWCRGIDSVMEAFWEWTDANVPMSADLEIAKLGERILEDARMNDAEARATGKGPGK